MKLRTNLFLLVLGTVLPFLALAVLLVTLLLSYEQESNRRAAIDRIRAFVSAVDAKLQGTIDTLQALGMSDRIKTGDFFAFRQEALDVLASQPDWILINLLEPTGQQVANTFLPDKATLPTVPDPANVKRAVDTRKAVIGDLVWGPVVKEYLINVRVPVSVDGDIRYVLTASFRPSAFQKLVHAQEPQWVFGLVDSTGRFIARNPQAPTLMASEVFMRNARSAPVGWYRGRTVEGFDTFTAHVTSPLSGWTGGQSIPVAQIYGSAIRAGALLGAGILLLLALALAFAYQMGRRITAPVSALASLARDLGESAASTGSSLDGVPERTSVAAHSNVEELHALEQALNNSAKRLRSESLKRDRAEQKLAWLASFPERNPFPIVEVDRTGEVHYINPAAKRLFPDLEQRRLAHPWLARWDAVLRQVQAAGVYERLVTLGKAVYQQSMAYVQDAERVRIYGADITEIKRVEDKLRSAAAFNEAVMNSIGEGLYTIDDHGLVTSMNPAAEQLFGWTFAELRGRKMHDITHHHHPDGTPFPAEQCAGFQVLNHGKLLVNHEDVFIRKDGTFFPVTYSISAMRDVTGIITGLVVIFNDITERKRADEELKRSRLGLSRLAEASLTVMRETDLNGMLQAVSNAALALTGAGIATAGHGYVNGQFMIGGSARAPGAQACPQAGAFLIEKGGVYMELVEGADTIRLSDAELRAHPRWWGLPEGHVPVRGLLGVRLAGRQGQTSGMLLVTNKEHGEFTAEDEVLLRQLANVASLALQHVEARISLEEIDRQKDEFLAMLSHELRNPLTPIRNSLYILDRAAPGGGEAKLAQTIIDRQVFHLTRLVDDLLDVTRISRGKIQLQREQLDVADVVQRAAEDQRASFVNKGIEFEVSVPGQQAWMHGDPIRIAQVISNLLGNAEKFTEAGGRTRVSLEVNTSLRQAIIRVRDTGAGIAPTMLLRVFEPFAQADSTLDRSKGGLGLGLALVKGLVEMHGGTVSVASEGLGKGAEFTICLPLETSAFEASAQIPTPPRSSAARRVLIIEDNVDAADSLRMLLELSEHTVQVAYSGTAGIAKAREFKPHLVLCDIGLPGMDGYEVGRAMRADAALREVTLVALTGYAAPVDLARSKQAGFDHHLAKPPSLEMLEEALAASVGAGAVARS